MSKQIKLSEILHSKDCTLFVSAEAFYFRFCRIIEVHIVLMRTQSVLTDELGNENFFINFSADVHISAPFRAFRVIRRCSRKRNDLYVFIERGNEFFKCFLPRIFEMMRFIKTDGFDSEFSHGGKDVNIRTIHIFIRSCRNLINRGI